MLCWDSIGVNEPIWGQKVWQNLLCNGQMTQENFSNSKMALLLPSSMSWAGCPWFFCGQSSREFCLLMVKETTHNLMLSSVIVVCPKDPPSCHSSLSLHSYQCFFSWSVSRALDVCSYNWRALRQWSTLIFVLPGTLFSTERSEVTFAPKKLLSQVSSKRKI